MQAREFNAFASLFAKGGNVEYALICRGLEGRGELTRRTKEAERVERDV